MDENEGTTPKLEKLMRAVHEAMARHSKRDRHTGHSVVLTYGGSDGWSCHLVFGYAGINAAVPDNGAGKPSSFFGRGASAAAAVSAAVAELRRPNRELLDEAKRDLAATADLAFDLGLPR